MCRLFPSHNQGACYVEQRKNNAYIFEITVIYVSLLQFPYNMRHLSAYK